MRTIIAGSRQIAYHHVLRALQECDFTDQITVVIGGAAKGPDSHGITWAKLNNIRSEEYPADWKRYGVSAGPIRNKFMANRSDALIAVWDGKSRGTKHMISIAEEQGLKTFVYIAKEETNDELKHDATVK